MKAGIIAAGKGERLASGGISTPKPLIQIQGEPLIARAIRAAASLNVTSVACIVNDLHPEVADYLHAASWPVPLEIVVKTTPSSMESLFALEPLLKNEHFLLFTVDAVFGFETLQGFADEACSLDDAQGVLALTGFVDDEKPLWVMMDDNRKITDIGDSARSGQYVTSGFYYFTPKIFGLIAAARNVRLKALRQFLGLLLEEGFSIYGVPVSKTLDVDYPEDIEKAEAYLREIKKGCAQ